MGDINHNDPSIESRQIETICCVLRDIYRGLQKDADKAFLKERLGVAFKMAKSMDAKLRQLNGQLSNPGRYDDDWWEVNKRKWDWEELKGDEKNE
tara:strand:- start:534 stop:818 length:285 start_codon:yes stop_codon:yes gene_type:complete